MDTEEVMETQVLDTDQLDDVDVIDNKSFIIDLVNKMDNRLSFVSRSGLKSEVWSVYQRIYFLDKETHFVKCLNCNDIKKQTKQLGTATLLRHHCLKDMQSLNHNHNTIAVADHNGSQTVTNDDESYNDKPFLLSLIKSSDPRVTFESHIGKSQVWSRFERVLYNHLETSYVKCKHCHEIQKQTQLTGTTSLLRHKCKDRQTLTDTNSRVRRANTNAFRAILRSKKCHTFDEKIRVENQTLKHLIKKCLEVIDKCLCIKRDIVLEKKQINTMINGYNEWLHDNQDLDELDTHKEDYENMFDICLDSDIKPNNGQNDDHSDGEWNSSDDTKPKRLLISRELKAPNRAIMVSRLVKKKYQKHKTMAPTVCDWPDCGKQFRNAYNYQQHHDKHMGLNKYRCVWPGCEETFAKKVNYEMHISLHTNDKKYKCDFLGCHYETCRNSLLKRHSKVHTGEKPFKCDWPGCEFRTSNKNGLRHHNYRHTGEKPWKCTWVSSDGTLCSWAFRQSTHLKAHKLKHTGERPYSCEWPNGLCDRRFASRQAMRFHSEKSHNFIIPQK